MLDQGKIGKFIAERRKLQCMTQRQLAEKLGISDKAVSKWETGKSMPDNSILMELCELLRINVNELLSGEMLPADSYHGKAEENMVNLIQESENEKKMRKRTWLGMLIGTVVLAVALWWTVFMSQGSVVWYLDLVSLLLVVVITFMILLSAGQVPDFFRAFSISTGRRKNVESVQVLRSLSACRLVLIAAPIVGIIVSIIGVISMFLHQLPADILGFNLSVALLSTLYGLTIDLFILPVAGRLRVMVK